MKKICSFTSHTVMKVFTGERESSSIIWNCIFGAFLTCLVHVIQITDILTFFKAAYKNFKLILKPSLFPLSYSTFILSNSACGVNKKLWIFCLSHVSCFFFFFKPMGGVFDLLSDWNTHFFFFFLTLVCAFISKNILNQKEVNFELCRYQLCSFNCVFIFRLKLDIWYDRIKKMVCLSSGSVISLIHPKRC